MAVRRIARARPYVPFALAPWRAIRQEASPSDIKSVDRRVEYPVEVVDQR